MQITQKLVADLKLSPLLKNQPGWEDSDPRFHALVMDVMDNGVIEPIQVTEDNLIIDGRHRWRAAKAAGLKEIPCILCKKDEAIQTIIRTITLRRHYTKGQIAYLVAPYLDAAIKESTANRIERIKKNPSIVLNRSAKPIITIEEYATLLGIGEKLLKYALQILRAFNDHPDWRAQDEPKILDPDAPAGLGAILAGQAGRLAAEAGKTVPNIANRQLELFNDGLTILRTRFNYWSTFNEIERRQAKDSLRDTIHDAPPDLLDDLRAMVTTELRNRTSLKQAN